MPMYMDIHEVQGATADDVAKAHVADMKTQNKYGVESGRCGDRARANANDRDPGIARFSSPTSSIRRRSPSNSATMRRWHS